MELMLKPEIFKITELDDAAFQKYQSVLAPVKIPLEQSPLWGNFDNAVAGRTFLGSFRYDNHNGQLVAIGSATLYRQKGRNWIWFKHGPLFASVPNSVTVKSICNTLQKQFSKHEAKPVFIRLSIPTHTTPLVLPFEHTMYDETVIVDLEKEDDEILASMSQSGRQGIRRSASSGAIVKEIIKNREEVFTKECYPILKETGSRDKFGIHPLNLYTALLAALPENARLYGSYVNGKLEAWAITTEYQEQSMYYYGGSSAHARDTYAAYALHWEIIKLMKSRGNKTYDFMGIAGKHFEGLKNVTQFKLKFSKNVVSVPVAYDLPLRPLTYHALALAIKTKRRIR